jgi:Protein of unknown function (DUF3187)
VPSRSLAFAILAVALTSGSLLAQGLDLNDDLLAPLPIRDQFLLNNGFLFFEPEPARVLDAGESAFTLQATDANTFAKSNWISRSLEGQTDRAPAFPELSQPRYAIAPAVFLADGETHRVEFAYRRGFGNHLELGVTVPVSRIGGGWSDRLIEVAHHELRIGNAERESLRQNSETVFLHTGTVDYTRSRSAGYALGDIAVSAKYELAPLEEKGTRVALAAAMEFPTGSAGTIDGSGSFDAGLQLMASRDFRSVRIHASLGMLRLGGDRPLGTRAQLLITDTVGISRLINPGTSVTMQLTVSESPFRNLGMAEFNRRSYQLSSGVQRRIGRSTVAYAAFIENLFNYDNSADAGFAWGISRRF